MDFGIAAASQLYNLCITIMYYITVEDRGCSESLFSIPFTPIQFNW